jgi:hypothetical protein
MQAREIGLHLAMLARQRRVLPDVREEGIHFE